MNQINGLRQAPVRAANQTHLYLFISMLHAISAHLSAIRAWPYWARLYALLDFDKLSKNILQSC